MGSAGVLLAAVGLTDVIGSTAAGHALCTKLDAFEVGDGERELGHVWGEAVGAEAFVNQGFLGGQLVSCAECRDGKEKTYGVTFVANHACPIASILHTEERTGGNLASAPVFWGLLAELIGHLGLLSTYVCLR